MKCSQNFSLRTVLVILILTFLFACQNKKAPLSIHSDLFPVNQTVEDGGVLVAGIRKEPESLNPLFALSQSSRNIIGLIYSRLANLNADLNSFSPGLAHSWEVFEKQRQVVFHLRTDVNWHDGVPFSAQDVVRTFELHTNPEIAWDGINFKENISDVYAPDDSTVIFIFNKPDRTILMDAVEGYILPAHLMNIPAGQLFTNSFNRHPVGTGPFRFEKWTDMQSITLVKNENYFISGKPHLDKIVFQIIPDNFNLMNQLKAGDIDLVEGIYPKDYQKIVRDWDNGKSNLRPITYMGRRYDFIGWNLIDPDTYKQAVERQIPADRIPELIKPNPLFGNHSVRVALTLALDRTAIMNTVNFGMAIPLHGPIPPILPAYKDSANIVWKYNPEKARQLLREQGWIDTDGDGIIDKNGKPFEFELITESGNLRWEQVATIVQDQLSAIGIKVHPRFLEPSLLYGKLLPEKDFDAVIIGWSVGLTPDFSPLFHSSTFFSPFHFTGYYSEVYDSLDLAAKTAPDAVSAQPFYDDIARLLSHDLPYTWLYYRLECSAVHSRFKNIIYDKRGLFNNPEDWWIPKKERITIDTIFEK